MDDNSTKKRFIFSDKEVEDFLSSLSKEERKNLSVMPSDEQVKFINSTMAMRRETTRMKEIPIPRSKPSTPPIPRSKPSTPPVPRSKPKMMGGGMYKGKAHSYAAGGMVRNISMMKEK